MRRQGLKPWFLKYVSFAVEAATHKDHL